MVQALPMPSLALADCARRVRPLARRAAFAAIAALAIAVPFRAGADEAQELELGRWAPSLAFDFDVLGERAEGAIQTNNVNEVPAPFCGITNQDQFGCPNSPLEITPSSASDDTSVAPIVGLSLELMTPRLLEDYFSPRLFAHVDAGISFGFERNAAGERAPGPFFADPLSPSEFDIAELSVAGQGSRAKFQVKPWVFGAGAGVAFTSTVFERTIRVKPSFEYFRHEIDLIASVRRAVKLVDPTVDLSLSGFRLIELTADSEETFDALGAGVEVEIDASRLGPFVMSVFAMGRGYKFTGNLRHTLTDVNERGEMAIWHYEFDPWMWRAGVGARFRWSPE
jgi:hypothetical protein